MKYNLFLVALLLFKCSTEMSAQWNNPMENVGIQHNALIKSIFPSAVSSTKSTSEARKLVRDELLKADNSLHWVAERPWLDPLVEANNLAASGRMSKKVLGLVLEDLGFIEKGGLRVKDVESYVNNRGQSSNGLNTEEAPHYHSFLAGLKYSAKLWLPSEMGGESLNDGFSPDWPGSVQARHFNPWKALGCDAVGCILGPQAGGVATLCSVINQWQP